MRTGCLNPSSRDFIKMPRTVLFRLAVTGGGNNDGNYITP